VRRSDVVGHVSHIAVTLQSGAPVALEGHVDKYPADAFPAGADVVLTWNAAEATVIPAS
jgi:hypothetical protein